MLLHHGRRGCTAAAAEVVEQCDAITFVHAATLSIRLDEHWTGGMANRFPSL
jgi:hypothetical protein